MAEINDPEISVERLISKMQASAARLRSMQRDSNNNFSQGSSFAQTNADDASAPTLPPLSLQPDFQPHGDDRYHARDLLKYHDRKFIQNAYLAILKRGPDATGYRAFIESLRAGRLNKLDILARLRYSKEGRAKKVQIEGLLLPAVIRQSYRIPLVGYLLQLVVGLARLPRTQRHQQQLEAHFIAQQEQIVDYTNQLNKHLNQHARDTARTLAQTRQQLESLAQEQRAAQADVLERLAALSLSLETRLDEEREQRERELDRQVGQLNSRLDEESARQAEHLELLYRNLRGELRSLMNEVERTFQKEQEIRLELALQGQRVARLLDEAQQSARVDETQTTSHAAFDEQRLLTMADEESHTLDAFYASLEERFRGSRAEITERLKIYLPLLKKAGVGSDQMPLLDIGCGRGEWLELLKDEGISANGVDHNRILVAQCRERGLEAVEADVMSYLRRLPDASLGALTGFHIVEHLPLDVLLKLLDETVRVVKPGGVVIFETPNPQNVLVGSCNFYFDPTHRNPLPPQIMHYFLESRGLTKVEIIKLNPSDSEPVAGDTDLVKRFNEYFYGPMDYAVVGYRR